MNAEELAALRAETATAERRDPGRVPELSARLLADLIGRTDGATGQIREPVTAAEEARQTALTNAVTNAGLRVELARVPHG